MTIISRIFGRHAPPVVIPYNDIKAFAASGKEGLYSTNNDFTDVVFRIMDIGRIHHAFASTTCYFTDPDQTFSLVSGNKLESEMKFHGSEGLFITAYMTMGWKRGLALVMRDQILSVEDCQPNKNVIGGIKGVVLDHDRFMVTGLTSGILGKDGKIRALVDVPVTRGNVERTMLVMRACMRQMVENKTIDLPAVVESVQQQEELTKPPQGLTPP